MIDIDPAIAPFEPGRGPRLEAPARRAEAVRPRTRVSWRAVAWQVFALGAVAVLAGWLLRNAAANLAARHIASGFRFLGDSAGFAISEGPVPYELGDTYARAFEAGIANTLKAALPAVVLASLLGLAAGIAQVSRNALVRLVAVGYVDIVRNVPLLVQVLLWYFALTTWLPDAQAPLQWCDALFVSKAGLTTASPHGAGVLAVLCCASVALPAAAWRAARSRALAVGLSLAAVGLAWRFAPLQWEFPEMGAFGLVGGATLSPEWIALVGALTLYAGAYCAEIVRAGLQAVPHGQVEAAQALGLTRGQSMARVILPQAMRVIAPPYTSLVMSTLKNSSLAVAIGYPDVVSVATTALNQNGQAVECIAIIASVYLALNLVIAVGMGLLNRRAQFKER
jgi:general L-amino acid transport system permease protein